MALSNLKRNCKQIRNNQFKKLLSNHNLVTVRGWPKIIVQIEELCPLRILSALGQITGNHNLARLSSSFTTGCKSWDPDHVSHYGNMKGLSHGPKIVHFQKCQLEQNDWSACGT